MNRKFLIGLLCLFLGAYSASASAFDDANRQFNSGDFAAATSAYEKILTTEGPRAAVYYNLGNSYQSLKKLGPAILAYERARMITPRDPDLSANLVLARKAAAAFDESGLNPNLEAFINYLSRNEWSWLVAGAALFLGGLAFICGMVKLPLRFRLFVFVSTGVALFAISAGAAALYLRRDEDRRGIILTENAPVLLSPFEKAESLGSAGQGRVVHLGAENGGFRYVEVLGANLHGWLASKEVSKIMLHPEDYGSRQ